MLILKLKLKYLFSGPVLVEKVLVVYKNKILTLKNNEDNPNRGPRWEVITKGANQLEPEDHNILWETMDWVYMHLNNTPGKNDKLGPFFTFPLLTYYSQVLVPLTRDKQEKLWEQENLLRKTENIRRFIFDTSWNQSWWENATSWYHDRRNKLNGKSLNFAYGTVTRCKQGEFCTETECDCDREYVKTPEEARQFLIDCGVITPDQKIQITFERGGNMDHIF